MKTDRFTRRVRITASADEVFAWHARPGAFERLTPPWSPVEVAGRTGGIEDGAEVRLRVPLGPLRIDWVARHDGYRSGRQFRDVQTSGPFARWEHTHRIEPDGDRACHLEDTIEYALPLAPLSMPIGGGMVRRMLGALFEFRHRRTVLDMKAHATYTGPPLSVVVSGASGLIGSSLLPFLTTGGHRVVPMVRSVRSSGGAPGVRWDPAAKVIDRTGLERVDAVVHLAGESIASGRWTPERKARIRSSRVDGTRLLCETLATLDARPRVLVCASAIGFYGDRGDATLDESTPRGRGFLADVCAEWEAATAPARAAGIRVVHLRFGVVLTPAGGALQRMLLPFRLGAGGVVGSGEQYMSWIAIDDAVGAIHHALVTPALEGPVNAVAPTAATNREFTRALGRVLRRPTIVPMPAVMARLAFGEMADALLLASTRVVPRRLSESGYAFREPDLDTALAHLLGRRR
jgi:uncharacterized protein (TIGR01777 family)